MRLMLFGFFVTACALDHGARLLRSEGQERGPHPGVPAAEAKAEKAAAKAETEKELLNAAEPATSAPAETGSTAKDEGLGTVADDGVGAAQDSAESTVADIESKMDTAEMEKAFGAAKEGDVRQFLRRLYAQMAVTLAVGGTVGLAFLGCVWYFACMGSERAPRRATKEELRKGDFNPVGVCACCQWKVLNICEALFCSPFLWAETAGKLQVLNFYALVALVFLALVLSPVTGSVTALLFIVARVWLRTYTMRSKFKQEGGGPCLDGCCDCCMHVFCFPCAAAQEAEFVEHLEQQGIIKV